MLLRSNTNVSYVGHVADNFVYCCRFQMVSLLKLARVTEEGVRFLSPHDGTPMYVELTSIFLFTGPPNEIYVAGFLLPSILFLYKIPSGRIL